MTTEIFENPGDPNGITWADFQRDLQAAGRSPRTIQSYGEAMAQLAGFCKDGDLLALERADIEAYLIHVRSRHSAATEQVRYRSLHRFYSWAEKEELITASPMRGMSLPSAEQKVIPVPARDDLRALLAACAGDGFDQLRDTAIIRLMADTGLRLSEVASLTLKTTDLRLAQVRIFGKGSKERVVPYERSTGKALARYLRARSNHPLAHLDALWVGSRALALRPNGIAQMLRRRCRQARIALIHPHQLRHWSASEAFTRGISDQDAMRLYGWTSLDMPRRYGAATAAERAIAHRRSFTIVGSL